MYKYFFKRFFDMLFSGLMLIILSPVFLIITIVSLINVGHPVVFSHYRPGKNNKIFKLHKFRSMTNKTGPDGKLLPDADRLTKYGKFLRKSNLDELPQLWNIFIGQMSFIGPRPKLVRDMVFFDEEQNKRSKVRPGITGWAQVNGRNETSWEETYKYDLEYVNSKNMFWMDIKIFFKTIGLFFKRNRAEEQGTANHEFYRYGDYLVKTGKITQEQYDAGLKQANDITSVKTKGKENI